MKIRVIGGLFFSGYSVVNKNKQLFKQLLRMFFELSHGHTIFETKNP
jgi:hypothetical protein